MTSKIATLTFTVTESGIGWKLHVLAVTSNHYVIDCYCDVKSYVIDCYCDVTISREAWTHCCVDLLESCNAEKSLRTPSITGGKLQ